MMTPALACQTRHRALRRVTLTIMGGLLAAALGGQVQAQEVLSKTEIIRGLGPVAAQADEARAIDLDIRFEVNSAHLSATAERQLGELGEAFRSSELATLGFIVAGHTDATGPADANMALSLRRAEAVKRYLVQTFGIVAERLSVLGLGEERLKRPFDTAAAANRRVEIIVRSPGAPEKARVDGIIRR